MPAVECKDSAQVANLTSTETEEIMNTFKANHILALQMLLPHAIYGSNEKSPAALEGDMLYFVCILVLRTEMCG